MLVGVTITPGDPGANRLTTFLLPVGGDAEAAGLAANVTVGSRVQPLRTCGPTCRSAEVVLKGGDALAVDVLGPLGGRASFTVPALPAAPAPDLLERMTTAMHRLKSYAVDETLSSGTTTIHSAYASQRPASTRWTVRGAGGTVQSQTVWIGTTQYTMEAPGQPWQVQRGLPAVRVPSFVWDYFQPLSNVSVLGTGSIDGLSLTVVSGFGNRQATPIWFTFWLDEAGLVHRVEMHAPGHFMSDGYSAFNEPAGIVAPIPG